MDWSSFLQGAPGGFQQGMNWGQGFNYNQQMHPLQIQQAKQNLQQQQQMNPLMLMAQQLRNRQMQQALTQGQGNYDNYIRMMDAITRSGMGGGAGYGVPGATPQGIIPQGLPPTATPQSFGGAGAGAGAGGAGLSGPAIGDMGGFNPYAGGGAMAAYDQFSDPIAANQFQPLMTGDPSYMYQPEVTGFNPQMQPLQSGYDYGSYPGMYGPIDNQGLLAQFMGLF